jgi:hypothetical protein
MKGKDVLRWASGAVLVLLLFGGCQGYHQAPINLEAYEASWLSRNLKALEIEDFSKELTPVGEEASLAFDPSDGISLREAERIALAYNPSLRAAREVLMRTVPIVYRPGDLARWGLTPADAAEKVGAAFNGAVVAELREVQGWEGPQPWTVPCPGRGAGRIVGRKQALG